VLSLSFLVFIYRVCVGVLAVVFAIDVVVVGVVVAVVVVVVVVVVVAVIDVVAADYVVGYDGVDVGGVVDVVDVVVDVAVECCCYFLLLLLIPLLLSLTSSLLLLLRDVCVGISCVVTIDVGRDAGVGHIVVGVRHRGVLLFVALLVNDTTCDTVIIHAVCCCRLRYCLYLWCCRRVCFCYM